MLEELAPKFRANVPRGSLSPYAQCLAQHDVCVVPFMPIMEMRQQMYKVLDTMVDEFPEYRNLGEGLATQRVLGGFGAYGNPSSFHHPVIRMIRYHAKDHLKPLFKEVAQQGMNLEVLFDRFCVRRAEFGAPQADCWHRDTFDYQKQPQSGYQPDDVLFGGWINFNVDRDQRFACLIGSAKEVFDGEHLGFDSTAFKQASKGFNDRMQKQALGGVIRIGDVEVLRFDSEGMVIVPSGHIVIMRQKILHKVVSAKIPQGVTDVRLFMGWRLTNSTIPLNLQLTQVVEDGDVPFIPSGQIPPMYAMLHINTVIPAMINRDAPIKKNDLRTWGKRVFKPQCVREIKGDYCMPGPESRKRTRSMASLKEYDLMAPEYKYQTVDIHVLQPETL
jgi:hypothetical protein